MFSQKRLKALAGRILFTAVFGTMLWMPVSALGADETPRLMNQEIITRGALLEQYDVKTSSGQAKVFVTKINLDDPYIKIGCLFGIDEKLGINQSIEKMAEESKAVAAINGGFFDTAGGSPLGPLVKDGKLITTPSGIDGMSVFAMTDEKLPEIVSLSFTAEITAENGQAFPVASFNKTNSLKDKLNIFDGYWNLANWPGNILDSYTAVVVKDGRITEILENMPPDEIPNDGYIILGNGIAAQFLYDNMQKRDRISLEFKIKPSGDWDLVLDAHTLLVDNGERVKFARNITGYHARTALGYSKDEKTLYWFTVELTKESSGMTLEELADFMVISGVEKGVNLDGGGSTTLVSRHPGDTDLSLINIPQNGSQRSVPDGLALYSIAPQGELKDFIPGLPAFLLINESANLSLKAVDEYDNPIELEDQDAVWSAADDLVEISGSQITGKASGTGLIEIKSGQMKKEYPVEIAGRDQVQSLDLGSDALLMNPGGSASLKPVLFTKSGKTRSIPAGLLNWEWVGVPGSVDENGSLKAGDVPGNGWIIGSYDRFSAMVPVQVGTFTQDIITFEENPVLVFSGLPQEVTGEFVFNKTEKKEGQYSAELSYNFSMSAADMKIAYGEFGEEGIPFSGTASGMSLWVYGDNSGNWLRAEIKDENGKVNYITLADKVNWNGWKEISKDFAEQINLPVLKRIYLVSRQDGLLQGSILLDQVRYKSWQDAGQTDDVTMKLFVNKNIMLVNGTEQIIDQGPVVENGRSYIPARYIVEAIGGKVFWNGQEKQVRILSGTNMIDLWINDKDHTIVNGNNTPSDTAPVIRNNRTMIPVRLVTESLGYQVDWNKGEITVH